MMVKQGIKFFYVMCLMGVIFASMSLIGVNTEEETYDIGELGGMPNSPYCLQMYTSIEKYSEQYNIPKYIAYNVAYLETGYRGPFDWNYDHRQISSAGAKGPMQIIPKYAHAFVNGKITEKELLRNIDLNVMVSMKMLRAWYKIHRDWTLACGAYNSGRPIQNEYARYASSNKNYKNKWVKY